MVYFSLLLLSNSVTTIFGFSPTGRHETILITEGLSDLFYRLYHFPIGILGQVWYLIVSIPDLCTLTYFDETTIPVKLLLEINDLTIEEWKLYNKKTKLYKGGETFRFSIQDFKQKPWVR